MTHDLRASLRELLDAPQPGRETVLAIVRVLDLAFRSSDADTIDLIDLLLAHFTLAGAPFHLARRHGDRAAIDAVVRAARAFVDAPDDARQTAFCEAATRAYPFGPGDGCFAVPELGDHGTPGAGCAGGTGSIAYLAPVEASAALLEAARRRVMPLLLGADRG